MIFFRMTCVLGVIGACLLNLALSRIAMAETSPAATDSADKAWPDVLVVDDFSNGLTQWDNQGTGSLSIVKGDKPDQKAMFWTAEDDGMGHIVFKNLDRQKIDFSQYDYMLFHMKLQGKKIWNLNPIIRQSPVAHGYKAMYYSVDSLDPFDQWFTYVQDLKRWENAWPDSYDPQTQSFELEVYQLAGPGHTQLTIDRIWLVRSPVKVLPSYVGRWSKQSDGSQMMHFDVTLINRSDQPIEVTASLPDDQTIDGWKVTLPTQGWKLAAGATGNLPVSAVISAKTLASELPYTGQVLKLGLAVKGRPQVVLTTDLALGTQPAEVSHPSLLCDAEHAAKLRSQYADATTRKQMSRRLLGMVRQAQKLMDYQATYPALAARGIKTDAITGGALMKVDVPNLPFNVYQDPISGRVYSGQMYDAGVLDWAGIHRQNAGVAQALAMGYLITGDKAMASKAAAILKTYIDVYPKLPIVAPAQTSPVGFAASGSVRIGSTYMVERVWLTSMAIALDSIRDAGVLTDQDVDQIRSLIFEPSAGNMMDHKVGAMNLQWQIQSASLFAGLASNSPSLVTRAMHDSHGILNLTRTGYLPSGQWWENPSYQNVTRLAAYPALIAAVANGIMPFDDHMSAILKACYQLHAPDERSPTLGTGGWTNFANNNDAVIAFSQWLTDPQLAWIATKYQPTGQRSEIANFAAFRQTTPPGDPKDFNSPIPTTTTLLPDYGGIAMRLPGTDQYCYFHFGRELVHGHRNKLSINAYGQGNWYARNIMGGYNTNFKNFLETIASSNTIMIDASNADADTGELLFHQSNPTAVLASAREIGAYKHVEHERSLALIPQGLIILDRVKSDDAHQPHTADWLYHTNNTGLSPMFEKQLLADTAPLGDTTLYESLKHVGDLKNFATLQWQYAPSKKSKQASGTPGGLVQAFLPIGAMNLLQIDDTFRPSRSLLWRQKGSLLRFGCVMIPYQGDKPPVVTMESIKVHDAAGKEVELDQAQAVRLKIDEQTITLLVNYTGKSLTADGLTSAERMSIKTSGGS